jgi:LmbE family N-acetylglucosaminyl deacetylase
MLTHLKQWFFKKVLLQTYQLFFRLNLKSAPLQLADKKCLLLAPHPDDESIGAGGTLALHTSQFSVVCLTNGNKGFNKTQTETTPATREQEFRSVMDLLKVTDVFWLGIEDGQLLNGYTVFETLDLSAYDVIFLPNLLDQHPDHKAVSWLVHQYFKNHPTKAKKDLQLAFYEVWSTLPLPNAFVDISTVADLKKSMINAHISQVVQKNFAEMTLALNRYRGISRGVGYAEAFCVMGLWGFHQMVDSLVLFEPFV